MNQTEQTLLDQMRITEFELQYRKSLLSLTADDQILLRNCRPVIESRIENLVESFYESQTSIAEISLLIGDADTLHRLKNAQRKYILDLFSGVYDLEYVNNRLRIGLVHKRIGVEPKLYLSGIYTLRNLLTTLISNSIEMENVRRLTLDAFDKLMLFDITLVFETYIRSLVSEIEIAKQKSERYASSLEEKVKERTEQLELMSRYDGLTGLLNVRFLNEVLTQTIRSAQRRSEPVSVVYMDVDGFKEINDSEGHQRGDEILKVVGKSINRISRSIDQCFRYGGDEFCIILPNCAKEEADEIYIHRLNSELAIQLSGLSLSVGIVQTGPEEFEDAEVLIKKADQAMYTKKKGAR